VQASLEQQIATLDQLLADSEKHGKALLARVRGLRKRAAAGELAPLAGLFDPVPRQVEQFATSVDAAREALTYDAAAALTDGSYLAELQAEALAQGVVLTERDGRLSAFPLLLKLEPRTPGIRIGRKLERRLRPSVLVDQLKQAQAATGFDATRVLGQMFAVYGSLARAIQPAWRPDLGGDGPVVALNEIHAALTVLPVAAASYPRDAFAVDLLRLNRLPDTRTAGGHRFSLPASTGSKGRDRLTVYDETGSEHIYVGIRFTRDGPPA
jgi:hypothetical protein